MLLTLNKYKISKKIYNYFNRFFGNKVKQPVLLNPKYIKNYCYINLIDLSIINNNLQQSNTVARSLQEDDWQIFKPVHQQDYSYILDINVGNYYLSNNYLFNKQHQPITDDRIVFSKSLIAQQYLPRKVKKLDGIICYLSNHWVENYYHWLQFTVPLLQYYKRIIDLNKIDFFYIGDIQLRRFHVETLQLLGIPITKIIKVPCTSNRIIYCFSYVNTKCGNFIFRSYDDIEFVRNIFLCHIKKLIISKDRRDKLYIKRGQVKNRKLINEDELETFLLGKGFYSVSMDNLSFIEQAFLFNNATCITGVHGAALANLMFINKGTMVIEIFPDNYQEISHFCTSYYMEADYHFILAKSQQNNLTIDINKLKLFFTEMGL